MENVPKGDLFEKQALSIINKMLEDGDLIFLKENARIFTKKKYPSIYREFVQFDITIELWAPNAERYSMIYFIECKNYSKRIPVGQIQKFQNDIQQVSGVNAKGIFISNMPFTTGAFSHAEKIGMMVVQGNSTKDFKIVLHKRTGSVNDKIEILKESINSALLDQGIEYLERIVDKQILASLITSNQNNDSGIDLLSKTDIKLIAENELNKINAEILINGYNIDSNILTDYLNQEYDIQIKTITENSSILGSCDIDNRIISINKSILGTPRYLFVLCHEFGHFILHQNLTLNQVTYDSFPDSEINFITGKHNLANPRHWIEWQANYFAISFLLPGPSLVGKLYHFQNRRGMRKDPIQFNDTRDNRRIVFDLISCLASYFNVSKTTIIYRLTELRHFKDNSRLKSVGQLINEYRANFFT